MAIEILWSDFSKAKLKLIYKYYKEVASEVTALKLLSGIIASTDKLADHPESGHIEPYEIDLFSKFRSVNYKKYKVFYIHKDDKILILNIINMKQDPNAIKKEMSKIKRDF